MEDTKIEMAPSSRRPLNGAGVRRIPGSQKLKIGTWNVRGLKRPEKITNLAMEMDRLRIEIMGLSEVKKNGNGKLKVSHGKTLYFSGSDSSSETHGVAVMINTCMDAAVTNFIPLSNRAMMLQLDTKPRKINLIQVYAPTADKPVSEAEDFYKEIEQLYQLTRREEINIVLGDLNAKVGQGEVPNIVGKWGLGSRNERGDLLVQFCQEKNLVITNTFFEMPKRRLYTWTSPAHTNSNIVRNQIDYVMINSRYRNCVSDARTYPGADIGSDHNPVVISFTCRLKYAKKTLKRKSVDISKINHPDTKSKVHDQINEWAVEFQNLPHNDAESIWSSLKSRISEINETLLAPNKESSVKIQPWTTDDILKLIEERRLHKSTNVEKYKELDIKIRRLSRNARNQWYESRCEYVESLMKKHDSFNLYKEIKVMAGLQRKRQHTFLVDSFGKIILDPQKKKDQWVHYIQELFFDNTRHKGIETQQIQDGPSILKSEVLNVLQKAKTGKAPGPDGINIEVLKLLNSENITILVDLFNAIYDTGNIPETWLKSTFITLPKKKNAKICKDFRTISLMSHVLKLFLAIIHNRIRNKCEDRLGDSQFGFRAGMGTREAQFALRVLIQKCKDMQQNVFLCFIDYEKAFDRVKHEVLIKYLLDTGLDSKDIRIIKNLYWGQTSTVRVDEGETDPIDIQRGVRQGCILSPLLFNLYSEAIMQEALENLEAGVTVNGEVINNLRYADDTILIASTPEGLQSLVGRVYESSKKVGLDINISKTKVMVVSCGSESQSVHIRLGATVLERVDKYKYLGSWLTDSWESDTEIRVRIEVARTSFMNMKKVLCCRQLSLKLRTRMLKCYIWPVVLYGCEAWTIKEDLRKRLEAFEMWTYRRMLRISWTDKVTNVEVLRRMAKKAELVRTIKQRKVAYLGHILRNNKYNLLHTIMMGKIAGKRKVGRRKMSWLRNIREWTGIRTVEQLFRLALDKERFQKLTADLQ